MPRRTGLQTNWTSFPSSRAYDLSVSQLCYFTKTLRDMVLLLRLFGTNLGTLTAGILNLLPRFSSSVWSVSLYIRYIHLCHPRNWLSFRWRSPDERNRRSFFRKLSVDLFCVDLGNQRAEPPTVSCQSGVFLAITIFPWLVDRNSEYTCEISRWCSCRGFYSDCCVISLVHCLRLV